MRARDLKLGSASGDYLAARKQRQTKIFSIYGQIESVVADAMFKEGKVTRIPFDMMPPTQQYDHRDRKAHCALVMRPQDEIEFNKRVSDLRA